jgi:two-component system, NtrC family, sensor kinase
VNNVENDAAYGIKIITTGKEQIYDFAVPVVIGKERLGTVRLGVSHKRIGEALGRLLWTIFLATAISVVLAALLGTLLARTMTKRIALLTATHVTAAGMLPEPFVRPVLMEKMPRR